MLSLKGVCTIRLIQKDAVRSLVLRLNIALNYWDVPGNEVTCTYMIAVTKSEHRSIKLLDSLSYNTYTSTYCTSEQRTFVDLHAQTCHGGSFILY